MKRRLLLSLLLSQSLALSTIPKFEQEIKKLGRQGQVERALQVYETIPSPTLREMNAVVDALARSNPQKAQEFVKQMPQTNVYTFGALMNGLSRQKNYRQAVQLLKDMKQIHNVQPNQVVYNAAITACAKAHQTKLAIHLLRESSAPNLISYNAAIFACAQTGNVSMALQLLDEMKRLEMYDQVTYATILSTLERAQEWETLLSMADEMRDQGFDWDVLALTCVLHACQQLGLAQRALITLKEFTNTTYERATTKRTPDSPDAVAYRLAISACARGGAWEDGLRLLDAYLKLPSSDANDVVAYTAAMTGLEYAGEWRQALRLLERMRKNGVEPNEVTFGAILGACTEACVKAESDEERQFPFQKAMQLLNILRKDPTVVKPNVQVYNVAIRTCAEALNLDRALELVDEMKEDGVEPTIVTFGTLMTACERVGDVEGTSKVFNMLRDADLEPNEIIYGAAISACRKANEAKRCLLLLRKMIREELRPNTAVFNTVLTALVDSDELDDAILVFKLLKSPSTSSKANRQTYNILVRAFSRAKKPREAHLLLQTMSADGLRPEVDLYTSTITAYERNGQPLQALRLMEVMRADGYDFYEAGVLNSAFKNGVKILSAVGSGLKKSDLDPEFQWAIDEDMLRKLNQTLN